MKSDKDIVLAAAKQNWLAFEYASVEMRMEKEIVMAAVQSDGRALQFASEELKKDQDVLEATMRKGRVGLIQHGKSENDSLEVS